MRLTLAALVTTERVEGRTVYQCRTLRGALCNAKDTVLSAALAKLAGKARKQVSEWLEAGKPQLASPWLQSPDLIGTMLRLNLTLRDRTVRGKVFCVTLPIGDRFVAFPTTVPDLYFELDHPQELEARATEVLTQWCQQQVKDDNASALSVLSFDGDAWLEPLEIDVEAQQKKKKRTGNILAAILGQGPVSGAEELHKVGQCLDYMVSDFDQAIGRTALVDEIEHVLSRRDRQGVLIVGASAVGKTAIFQECVKRRFERFQNRRGNKPQTWWISPQRLVSGMMFLGQWEQRWLAILREAAKRDHILYFEDLVGLYTAGLTRDSRLCAADVLKSFLSEHRVRIVGETTPEELAVLRRRDRSLADRFHLVHVPSLSSADCLPILLEAIQRIETRKNVFFHPAVAPLAIRQQEVLSPNRAFPGKAIELIKSVSDHNRVITPTILLLHLHQQTGTSMRLLFGNLGEQHRIAYQLSTKVIGQSNAIDAMSRVVVRFTGQLQPNDKPVGVLLFLGPTGVGKTESAKALSELLFSDASHMIRIDMNEITTPLAAEQLVGTFDAPEGRLTSAVRRQPHCVILLDEIEKAHRDVFDYLLQVLGEGRLTDARGRVVDFRSSIIIMTSNLGAHQQGANLGFDNESDQNHAYVRAAERFFRPEFFNRIDEVIAFRPLEASDIKQIVLIQLRQLLAREGLKRRHVFVRVEQEALDHAVEIGFDKKLGARAVRRALEREIVQPLGDRLSELAPEFPVLIRISHEAKELRCQTLELKEISPPSAPSVVPLERLVEQGKQAVDRFEKELATIADEMKSSESANDMNSGKVAYYTLHEQIYRCSSLIKNAKYRLSSASGNRISAMPGSPATVRRTGQGRGSPTRRMLREWMADEDLRETISDEGQDPDLASMSTEALSEQLAANLTITSNILDSITEPHRWVLGIEAITRPHDANQTKYRPESLVKYLPAFDFQLHPEIYFLESLANCLLEEWQYEVQPIAGLSNYLLVSGVAVSGLLRPLVGSYIFEGSDHARDLCYLRAIPVPTEIEHDDLASFIRQQPVLQSDGFAVGKESDPFGAETIRGRFGDALIDFVSGSKLDLLSSSQYEAMPSIQDWVKWWTNCLPRPKELASPARLSPE